VQTNATSDAWLDIQTQLPLICHFIFEGSQDELGTLGVITRQAHHHFSNHLDHDFQALHRFRRV